MAVLSGLTRQSFIPNAESDATHPHIRLAEYLHKLYPINDLLIELNSFLRAENYNGLVLRLDPATHGRARTYLENAANVMVYPTPELTPDGDGGIEIEWENNGRRLVLSCKAHQDDIDFLSWREAQGQYDGRPASQDLLADRLAWLIS